MIRGPYNANKHSSYVELVIVVDNKVYKSFGESPRKVHQHCKDLANIINAVSCTVKSKILSEKLDDIIRK